LTDGYNGLRVVEIIEAAQRSLKSGGSQEMIASNQASNANGHVQSALSTAKLEEYAVAAD
jgi:hypothetical protein